ncbi:hypothetical protein QF035_009042 [Streptomyces umbrinus]|uniref:Aminotransferase n=1 Tax=Streptomyces umbrinus TaxID=67370 RepID=A0ABU0T6N3_9ACTN|nr:hypothetical protein [Streptomyces umbrinus]MDQ1031460.1 hypothetical protein [Streptomyces umbrinus]
MTRLIAPVTEDAPCVAVYRELRDGVSRASSQIGYGYNLYPAAGAVHRFLHRALTTSARTGRLHEYGTAHDAHDRALAAALAGAYLGLDLDEAQIVFTAGATEGIGLVTRWLAACDAGLLLPAPCYYAFEQTPRRWGGAVVGRYRHDGTLHPTGDTASHTALVEIFPNGVTGTLYTPPPCEADFRLVDIVFLAGGTGPHPHQVTHQVRATLDGRITDTAVLMTPSKDLCVPGLRPGLLISGSPSLAEAARDDIFDRTASASPLAGQLVLLYLTVLLLAEAAHEPGPHAFEHRYRWIVQQYARHGVDTVPSEAVCRSVVGHLDAMSRHFANGFDLLTKHADDLLETGDHLRPVSGYSLLPRLNVDLDDPAESIAWINAVGRQFQLKLNPQLLFGGTKQSWHALSPGAPRIRVNLSVPHDGLLTTLDLLREAHRGVVLPQSRTEAA